MEPEVLWSPSPERRAAANLTRFAVRAADRTGREFADYASLHRWSVEDVPGFWRAVWDFCEIAHSGTIRRVMSEPRMPGTRWFAGVRLNFAENLLRGPERPAVIFECEDEALRSEIGLGELRALVARAAVALRGLGVQPGDRVAALTPNIPEALVTMLAAASIGAIWSSCSPDFGVRGVLDRFEQIEPRVLLSADGYVYGGKRHGLEERLRHILEELPTVEYLVVVPFGGPSFAGLRGQVGWDEFLGAREVEPRFEPLDFHHPLYILYTSGTTGVPKCIVHGAGGTLIKHLQELTLQVDVHPGDTLFYFTTCSWMMWNWLASGLACGATVVLYDGNPMAPDAGRLFRMIDRDGINVFGTSPRYLSLVERSGLEPRREYSLESLRTVLSTGSPLNPAQFDWLYRAVKADVHVASMSGGTDLIGCFVGGAPTLPVHRGEIQCRTLGMDVESYAPQGQPVVGIKGELVCRQPFPSMPLRFWNDPDGSKYRAAYFERFAGCWHHGDFIEFTERGSAVIHGRSDATLNPGGVRIGTAEIYRQVETLDEVADAIAAPRDVEGNQHIVLFVVLREGAELDDSLREKIRSAIRRGASPRHVPREIHDVPEVPRTISGKAVELAVADVLAGREVVNRDALANPDALEAFRAFRDGGFS
ncbi:MAG: acetoacetate--CoA ligase [Planctomycetota bacterium]|nr:acetoacetate--CoA ligase [Planctomycetota bacterium]